MQLHRQGLTQRKIARKLGGSRNTVKKYIESGGVPEEVLYEYDRMRNVFIGRIAGKDRFNDTLMGFALHYGFKPEIAPAYAAWVKGKVEKPYRYVREGFWRGYGYMNLETANRDLTI